MGVSKSKISRILTGEISSDTLELIDELHMEYPVIDTLFSDDAVPSTPLAVMGDDHSKLHLAEVLYKAARSSHGAEAVRIYRMAIRIDLDASVDMSSLADEGRIYVLESRLEAIKSLLSMLPDMVPSHMRRAVELGVSQNTAAVQFLLDKFNAGKGAIAAMSPDSPSIRLYEDLFEECKHLEMSGKGEQVHRTVMLYSGINLIEALVEAGLTDRIVNVYDDLVEFFGLSKKANIGRLLYFNMWAHNRPVVQQLINPPVAA